MGTPSQSVRLSDEESADLRDRVERFRAAWQADGSGGLKRFLPPQGARHRAAVLVEVLVADMERRAAAGLPVRVEAYTNRLPNDLAGEPLPVALLAAEYRVRHEFGDKPGLEEYRERFPDRFSELVRYLAEHQSPAPEPLLQTRRASLPDAPTGGPRSGTMGDHRRTPPAQIGDLVATNVGNLDSTPNRVTQVPYQSNAPGELVSTHADHINTTPNRSGGASTILPADAPYELVRRIGSGAFGEVFEALAPGGIRVAVKRILRSVDHPASKSERDALEAIKGLSHPFLLKTNAYWVFDDRLVIVMELADGSLADRVEYHQSQGRLGSPPEELIPLFEQAAEALDYLHSQNISHRDVKPENILLLKGYAKVADFGLARPHEHVMTMVGNTVGTPAYMAPEMWQQKVSLQSDQYSLAATYVRARLGRSLFATTVLIEMASFHIHETPDLAPLSSAEQAVLLRALAKNPDDRYPTCAEFAKALRAAVLNPSLVPEPEVLRRTGGSALREALAAEPEPRSRGWGLEGVLRVAATAVACVLSVGIAFWIFKPPEPQPPIETTEKKFAVYPAGWAGVESAGTRLVGEKHYHHKLTRTIADEELVAVLVWPTQPNDPDEFYILQNKITNRVFAQTWNDVIKNQKQTVDRLKARYTDYIPGDWREGAESLEGMTRLGIDRRQAGVPVLHVTLPEAMLVAGELGGRPPTVLQWKKAAGATGDDKRAGPAGDALAVPPNLKGQAAAEFKRNALIDRNLALGLTRGPWAVDRLTADVSEPWKIHQLVSNGQEWLGEDLSKQPVNLAVIPDGPREAVVVGRGPNDLTITTFDALHDLGSQPWGETKSATGFRIVLKPK